MIDSLAPEVGLEPTTLRLTARYLNISALLRILLYCSFSVPYWCHSLQEECGD